TGDGLQAPEATWGDTSMAAACPVAVFGQGDHRTCTVACIRYFIWRYEQLTLAEDALPDLVRTAKAECGLTIPQTLAYLIQRDFETELRCLPGLLRADRKDMWGGEIPAQTRVRPGEKEKLGGWLEDTVGGGRPVLTAINTKRIWGEGDY